MLSPLLPAFLLDALLGDPRRLPHPIRLFGNIIAFFEQRWNRGQYRFQKGALLTILLVCGAWAIFYAAEQLLRPYPVAAYLFAVVFIFYGLANRSLIGEALEVEKVLSIEGLEAGRKRLSWIVGRDTSQLNATQIRTAVLETLAENLSDGVVAPLFYFAIGGVPLMFAYKMVNTLDSMIGYKSERYRQFGSFAARTDDVFNFIPARITALLMLLVTFRWNVVPFVLKYGPKHASPNSGYPESAMAGILKCRFGGPNVYHGVLVEKPFIGENQREITAKDIRMACAVNFAVATVAVLVIVLLRSYGT
ncbi:adenosylcobinamide-phosphate synthase CbiB [Paludibacter jiangxiensis]|uniref:Cobalamin biosynthesis protein CobD n=1 Tax=Paludibacter jiangxiensis TaxID=681398 RepID=A0A161L977_9BACT|nr:adenosylcobinamide-phosphate synthase CbiB [Paludibacter jiangxiensis]GAT63964.1 adenosylcobinamide-phosphate synthase [Paludibacter jiangxiensis]